MYLLRAPESYPKFGKAFNHQLVDGCALVHKQWYWHVMMRHGFTDVTPVNWDKAFAKPEEIRDVLIFHRSGAGDTLFMTPVIKKMVEKYPGVKIQVATNQMGQHVLARNPHINGFFQESEEYLAYYADEFDDSICFNGIMTKSHEANLMNVYDMYAQWAGIELSDDEKKPTIYLTQAEHKLAENLLVEKLQWKTGDRLVAIQMSASSPVRSVEEWKMVEVAMALRDFGYKVFVYSKTFLDECIYMTCFKCGNHEIVVLPEGFNANHWKCHRCDNVQDTVEKGIKGIFCGTRDISMRTIAAIISKAAYHIGPDSMGNHIAAAFDIPSLALFSSFDADLRLRYYKYARWIQKPFPCAPCFSHHMQCRKNIGGMSHGDGEWNEVAPCMSQFTVEEILHEFRELVCQKPFYRPESFVPNQDPRDCPVCGSLRHHYVNRKGDVCYLECLRCKAVFTDREVVVANNPNSYYEGFKTEAYASGQKNCGKILHAQYFNKEENDRGKLQKVLDIGCGVAHTLAQMQELGWVTMGLDFSDDAIAENKKLYPELTRIIKADVMELEGCSFHLIWMNNVLEHIHNPGPVLDKIWGLLKDDGILSVQIPDLDNWRRLLYMGKWEGVNTSYAGEHSILYDRKTLIWMMQEHGFNSPVIERHPGPECLWMTFKKVSNVFSVSDNQRTFAIH